MSTERTSFFERIAGRIDQLDGEGLQRVVQRLARERDFLETLFDTIEDGVLVLDGKAQISWANQSAEHLLGLPLDKLEQDSPWLHRFTALNKIIKAKNSQPQPVPEQRQTAGKSRNLSPEVPCPPGTIEDMATGQCVH